MGDRGEQVGRAPLCEGLAEKQLDKYLLPLRVRASVAISSERSRDEENKVSETGFFLVPQTPLLAPALHRLNV